MNQKTPKALAQFSVILVVTGIVVGDPLAGFFFLTLAGIVTALTLAFGTQEGTPNRPDLAKGPPPASGAYHRARCLEVA